MACAVLPKYFPKVQNHEERYTRELRDVLRGRYSHWANPGHPPHKLGQGCWAQNPRVPGKHHSLCELGLRLDGYDGRAELVAPLGRAADGVSHGQPQLVCRVAGQEGHRGRGNFAGAA